MANAETITAGKVVSIHYRLTLDDGRTVDSSEGGEPLSYLHGAGNIVPGLETALEGLGVGTSKKVSVPPEEAYGERHEAAIQEVRREAFPKDAPLEAGLTFQALDQDQNTILGTITAVRDGDVTVDFNHPLAGQTLHFDVEVAGVRDASEEERTHGHPHGPGGHHH